MYTYTVLPIISIHAPTRGATLMSWVVIEGTRFQSTLPREERRIPTKSYPYSGLISIHAPTRGATMHFLAKDKCVLFQSTLPREERRWLHFNSICTYLCISIHAPTRGATLIKNRIFQKLVFQSTLPREERPLSNELKSSIRYFNPRSHERSDTSITFNTTGLDIISIHAPTRGATVYCTTAPCLKLFQSTLPREERQQYCTKNLFIFIQYRQ